MVILHKKAATKKSFANMITVVRLHLMSYVELPEFIKDAYKHGEKHIMLPLLLQHKKTREELPQVLKHSIFKLEPLTTKHYTSFKPDLVGH